MSFNTTTYESYMHALKKGLESFDSALADEIIHDFESHFADARSQGLSDEEICAELGDVTMFSHFSTRNMPRQNSQSPAPKQKLRMQKDIFQPPHPPDLHPNPVPLCRISMHSSRRSRSIPILRIPLLPSPAWKSFCEMPLLLLFQALPPVFLLTVPENWIQTGLKLASMAILLFTRKENFCCCILETLFLYPPENRKIHLSGTIHGSADYAAFCKWRSRAESSFTGKTGNFSTNGKLVCNSLTVSDCHLQAANGKLVLTDVQADNLELPPQTENCRHLPAAPALF